MSAAAVAPPAAHEVAPEEAPPDPAPFGRPPRSRFRRLVALWTVLAVTILVVLCGAAVAREGAARARAPGDCTDGCRRKVGRDPRLSTLRGGPGTRGWRRPARRCWPRSSPWATGWTRIRRGRGEPRIGFALAGRRTLSPATTERIGLALGGDLLVLGSYATAGLGERTGSAWMRGCRMPGRGRSCWKRRKPATARSSFRSCPGWVRSCGSGSASRPSPTPMRTSCSRPFRRAPRRRGSTRSAWQSSANGTLWKPGTCWRARRGWNRPSRSGTPCWPVRGAASDTRRNGARKRARRGSWPRGSRRWTVC